MIFIAPDRPYQKNKIILRHQFVILQSGFNCHSNNNANNKIKWRLLYPIKIDCNFVFNGSVTHVAASRAQEG